MSSSSSSSCSISSRRPVVCHTADFEEDRDYFDRSDLAAKLVQVAKEGGPWDADDYRDYDFVHGLVHGWTWVELPGADLCQCADVLRAFGALDYPLYLRFASPISLAKDWQVHMRLAWSRTWQAFISLLSTDLSGDQPPSLQSQELSEVLYACAKLRHQPPPDQLQLLLKAFMRPAVFSAAEPQAIAKVIWALGQLSSRDGWAIIEVSPGLMQLIKKGWTAETLASSHDLVQQLLNPGVVKGFQHLLSFDHFHEVLRIDGFDANREARQVAPRAVSTLLVGLARMCQGSTPLLSVAAAQGYAGQVLSGLQLRVLPTGYFDWTPEQITTTLWALGVLQLRDEGFIRAAAASFGRQIRSPTGSDIIRAVTALARLQYHDQNFMRELLEFADLLARAPGVAGEVLTNAELYSLDKICAAIVMLDMRQLAGLARLLLARSTYFNRSTYPRDSLRRLWVFHSWLVEHKLAGKKGLEGFPCLEGNQLQDAAEEAAKWGDKPLL